MAGIREIDKQLFPIKNINQVIQLFKNQLEDVRNEPDLALLSIVAGAVENSLTCRTNVDNIKICEPVEPTSLPIIELHIIESLYVKFHTIIKNSAIDYINNNRTATTIQYATRDIVKKVSDIIWNSLTRSYYKDRAHLQSLYSYLTGNKLDCFGVAFAVVAGCQVLGYNDVHLALSEDHAWVIFGKNGQETAEVTWHGKGNEDKRGQEIGKGVSLKSWLYVNNKPVICTRHMEVAALVSAINPSLNATHDAYEVALLQQELLWLLYDLGHLKKYPMAIGNLGDLEEIAPKEGRIPCNVLFEQAISSARTYYNNQHVYPYTYQGGYFYRNKMYKEAFESWANASDVIRLYNYSRDDEEIYKEFLEIANELIPHIMKVESSGFSANTILKQPQCFANLLRFYDGICQWEEGSATPVLHIGWAKPLVNTISKFDADVRAQVDIICDNGDDLRTLITKRPNGGYFNNNNNNNNHNHNNNNNNVDDLLNSLKEQTGSYHPSIEALTAACSEKILNPDYLLQGDGSPFVGGDDDEITTTKTTINDNDNKLLHIDDNDVNKEEIEPSTSKHEEKENENNHKENQQQQQQEIEEDTIKIDKDDDDIKNNKRPTIILHSHKMKELKDLLLAEKLNTHAISLHLTAQSQVQVGKKGRNNDNNNSDIGNHLRPKRARRE